MEEDNLGDKCFSMEEDDFGDNNREDVILHQDPFLNNGKKKAPLILTISVNFHGLSLLFEFFREQDNLTSCLIFHFL